MKKRNKYYLFTATVAALFLLTSCLTKECKLEQADNKLAEIVQDKEIVGLATAVIKDGELQYSSQIGFSNLEEETELKSDNLFRIASISKSFTATAVMSLVEKGVLSLDDDVSDLVGFTVRNPNFPDKVITLEMLLSHTSSLNDSRGYFSLNTINSDKEDEWAGSYSDWEPGSKYNYCNLGYNTIGAIVEKYAEQRFDKFINETILDPMGLIGSFNVDALDRSKFASIYDWKEEEFVESPSAYASPKRRLEEGYEMGYSTPILSPTGGMKISAEGLARYMAMHINKGTDPKSGVVIISQESSAAMQTPIAKIDDEDGYGYALRTASTLVPGVTLVGHTGSAYGLYSAMFFNPENGVGVVMITNGYKVEKGDSGFHLLQEQVIRELYTIFAN